MKRYNKLILAALLACASAFILSACGGPVNYGVNYQYGTSWGSHHDHHHHRPVVRPPNRPNKPEKPNRPRPKPSQRPAKRR
ncbi:hypothetical protein [Maridesulfovibrio frigidus]|uniref:hypothetical protein n=1 Tax=Maridesulfovibrio frigidus TaxID=340956 RepID=UPI0012EB9B49|nr:hypothetical protein [Maridesulfovibrio frigidus]